MPTRLKRPAFWRPLGVAIALLGFQGYLGYSAIGGQFGIESHKHMQAEILELEAKSLALQAQIEAYRHRMSLFDASRLDPDILSERARALLSMAQPDEVLVLLDSVTGKPISRSPQPLAENKLSLESGEESGL